jgi:UDP-2-acetamido-3-amino-2,3-dideoxy-glucuronate N-acetyltransferase
MVFTNVHKPRSEYPKRRNEYLKTVVRKGATIGANATVVCGNAIGRYAFIGAGSVVTKDIPDYTLSYGNPVNIKGWVCECGERLAVDKKRAVCAKCKRVYGKGFKSGGLRRILK